MSWTLLRNSIMVSALTTGLAVVLGFAAALFLAGLERRWRTVWLMIAGVALCLPPFLVTNCWLHYLGHGGVWRGWLPLDIYSLGGTVWILSLLTWPVTLIVVLGAWRQLEAAQLESDMAVTGLALVRGLLLPLARGPLLQGAVLTFVLALNNFAVPAILQVKVFTDEVWLRFYTMFDSLGALQVSWPMILLPMLLLVWLRRNEMAWPRVEGSLPARLFRRQLGPRWHRCCGVVTILLAMVAVCLPVLQLMSTERTWSELPGAIAAGQSAIWHSIAFSTGSAALCVLLGFVGWRWPVGLALWLPFLVPGVLLGIGLIAVFNHPFLVTFYQSAGIVVLALSIRYLALGWNGVARALRTTDGELTDAARLGGASGWQMLRHVLWPQISPQVSAVWYLVFLLCLWDVESIVLVVPPGNETVALRVFNLLHYGHNTQVNALCLTLLGLAIAPLLLWGAAKWMWELRRGASALLCAFAAVVLLTGCSQNTPTDQGIDSRIFSRVQIIGTRGVGVGEFNKPRSIAIDREDNIYVADMTGRVQKFTPDGKFLLLWQMPQTDLGKPKGMILDSDGNVVVIEPHYQRINHFSTEGKLLTQWGTRGTNTGQLIMPRSMAVDSHGNMFISEYTIVDRVQEFSPEKKLLNIFGHSGTGPGEFDRPEGLGIDAADRLYVADSSNHRIQVFSPDGKFLRCYGKPGSGLGELSYPYDVRVDREGRQYVCEFGNSRIQVFDPSGKPIEIIGRAGTAPGEFGNPYAIALDSKGNLYVADSQNHRVQKFLRRQDVADAAPGRNLNLNLNLPSAAPTGGAAERLRLGLRSDGGGVL
jgi:ABC-type Fe3+ transport system permease subunit/DNA-binding beta-propeller fold protein YncE